MYYITFELFLFANKGKTIQGSMLVLAQEICHNVETMWTALQCMCFTLLGLCCFSIAVRNNDFQYRKNHITLSKEINTAFCYCWKKMLIVFLISFRIIDIWCQMICIPWFNTFYINILTIRWGRKKESRACQPCSSPNACYIFTTHDIKSNATSNGEHYFPIDQNQNVRFFYTWSYENI